MSTGATIRAVLLLAALVTGGCSSPASRGAPIVDDVSASIGTIRSGDLEIAFTMSGGPGDAEVGFRIAGPFSLGADDTPPVADLTVEQVAGDATTSTRFVMDGDAAYAVVDDRAYVLPEEQRAAFTGFAEAPEGGALASLDLGSWIEDPRVVREGSVGGEPTRVISGDVRVPEAVAGIGALFGGAGAADVLPAIPLEEDRERLERAVRNASIEIEVGREDGIFRSLVLEVVLGPADEALRDLAGARLRFTARVAQPNEPVEVVPPADAEPLPA